MIMGAKLGDEEAEAAAAEFGDEDLVEATTSDGPEFEAIAIH